jgi:NAD(P)-dependent dehydrogenase (short-subunit alcohol dehydrogenase family)
VPHEAKGEVTAIAMATEGADIIALDICGPIPSITTYPPATADDLKETARLVEEQDRRIVARTADVRERAVLAELANEAVADLGQLDIVVANAGVVTMAPDAPVSAFIDTMSINFGGFLNTIHAAWPHLKSGASVIAIGSMAAMMDAGGTSTPGAGVGGAAYSEAKRDVARLVHHLAIAAGSQNIRVNAIHPGNVETDMFLHEEMYRTFRPDLEDPTQADAMIASLAMHVLPTPMLKPQDISNAVVFLASEGARYITGMQMNVDAGGRLRSSRSGAPIS